MRTQSDPTELLDAAEREVEAAQGAGVAARRRLSLASMVWIGLSGLVSLGVGLWIDGLIEALFARARLARRASPSLSPRCWSSARSACCAREFVALARQRRIAELHAALALARAEDDRDAARALTGKLVALYAARPGDRAARGRKSRRRGAPSSMGAI